MALPRTEQDLSKDYSQLGVEVCVLIDYFLPLCKGITPNYNHWFFRLFIPERASGEVAYGTPTDTRGVQEVLQRAWWVEEEDIIQQVMMAIYDGGLNPKNYIKSPVARYLRDWLLKEGRVLSRTYAEKNCWFDAKYSYQEHKEPNVSMVFNNNFLAECSLTLFEKYLLYLMNVLHMSKAESSRQLGEYKMQISRFFIKLSEKLQGVTDASKEPTRLC